MIELKNVTKSYLTRAGREYIFRDLSFTIPGGRNVAIIGRNGAGKSTLMRLLGGIDVPDKGKVVTSKTVSWPVGLAGGFQGALSGRENVKFVARVHGATGAEMALIIRYVERFAEIGRYFDQPVSTYSSGMRGRVAFGLSLAFHFDYYLVDEAMSVGDAHFKKKATRAFRTRVGEANIILVTHGMSQIRALCDMVLLIKDGEITRFDDIEQGISEYEKD